MKQTAVDWLLTQIENKNGKEFSSYYTEFIEQAKEMEKEQICDAYYYGIDVDSNVKSPYQAAEQYYKQTYESNT